MIFDYKGITNKNKDLIFIAGPCVIESEEMTINIAKKLKEIKEILNIQLVFKGSYDKANRTSLNSFRGLGMKNGLEILKTVSKEFNLPTITDIHIPTEAEEAAKYVDFLQIPAFLCRQTDMLRAACETGKAINIKKGQFISGYDCKYIADKCSDAINEKRFFLCERGTMFGYGNLIVDMKNIEIMKNYAPVIYDATHSLQMPSAEVSASPAHPLHYFQGSYSGNPPDSRDERSLLHIPASAVPLSPDLSYFLKVFLCSSTSYSCLPLV